MLKKNNNKNIDLKTIKKKVNYLFYRLAQEAFLVFIIICLLVFFSAGIVFYFYVYLPTTVEPEVGIQDITIDEKLYEEFIGNYNSRKEMLNIDVELRDPFYLDY